MILSFEHNFQTSKINVSRGKKLQVILLNCEHSLSTQSQSESRQKFCNISLNSIQLLRRTFAGEILFRFFLLLFLKIKFEQYVKNQKLELKF